MIEFYDSKLEDMIRRIDGKPKQLKLIIKTDAPNVDDFIDEFGTLFMKTIEKYKKTPEAIDWNFLLLKFVDIVCKMRNYKADVIQRTIYVSGGAVPGGSSLLRLDDDGNFFGAPDAMTPGPMDIDLDEEFEKAKVIKEAKQK